MPCSCLCRLCSAWCRHLRAQQARGDQAVQYDLGAGGYYACYHGGFQHFYHAVPYFQRLSVLYHCVFAGGRVRGDLLQAGRPAQHVFLHDDGARGMGRYILHRPRMFLHHQLHRLNRTMRAATASRPNDGGSTQNSRSSSTAGTVDSGYRYRSNRPDGGEQRGITGGCGTRLAGSACKGLYPAAVREAAPAHRHKG